MRYLALAFVAAALVYWRIVSARTPKSVSPTLQNLPNPELNLTTPLRKALNHVPSENAGSQLLTASRSYRTLLWKFLRA